MENTQAFLHYLAAKGKNQSYLDMSRELTDSLRGALGKEPPSSEAIDRFVRKRWSGYVSRDKDTYQILNEYADFCETETPLFANAFREHVRATFEGEARKAVRAYKKAIVPIPQDTTIDPSLLGGLTNDEFVKAFRSLQKLICAIYDDIECGSPFDWGWPDWRAMTADGLEQNRVMLVLAALADSGFREGDTLVVDQKRFSRHPVCKPIAKTKRMLEKFVTQGFRIENLNHKSAASFVGSYPGAPHLIFVFCAYFKNRSNAGHKNHTRVFSYRFVESPAVQDHETFFLAKTDGEPEPLREIYYWLYSEAVKHGFSPQGHENMGCYVYQNDKKEWLLLGGGSSYHEDEFLHSPNYKLAAKVRFHHVFETHPEGIHYLRKRFPDSFGRPWTQCFRCKAGYDNCKNRVTFKKNGHDYHHCGTKHHLYFHDPALDDLKVILELYKSENKIAPR